MKIKALFGAILGSSLFLSAAQSADVSPGASSLPEVGNFKCSLYNDHKGEIGQLTMLSWVQGQISGTDIIRTSVFKQKSLMGIVKNNDQITELLNNSCDNNPDESLYPATTAIYFSLNSALLEKPKEEQGDNSTALILGTGNEACSFYNTHRKERLGSLVISWVQGEFAGMDAGIIMGTMGSGILDKVHDKNTLNTQFAKECRTDPSQQISTAGAKVFTSLVKKYAPKN